MENIKGYKVFNPDWTCRDFQYQVGNTYEKDAAPSVCTSGFHFCKQASDCFSYYRFNHNNKVAEVLAMGEVSEKNDKCCTNKIRIVREVPWQEVLTLVNIGKACTGLRNSGDRNSGGRNSGHYNSGNRNSGDCNSGYRNSGGRNSGHYNSGDCNSGDLNSGTWNTGNYNTGAWNTGNHNSGNHNTGNYNSGDRNSGTWNTGDYNSGDWNSGDWNTASQTTGCFNTESQKLKFFDQETEMTFDQWRDSEAKHLLNQIDFNPVDWVWAIDMTDAEKAEHPEHETTGGYLKIRDNTDCCAEWWKGLSEKNKAIIKSIPNFDAGKFLKITGIQV